LLGLETSFGAGAGAAAFSLPLASLDLDDG
jgi:hypothetical protein